MITSPPAVYVSTKTSGLTDTSLWSYGTINLKTRFIKKIGKDVQGLQPIVVPAPNPITQDGVSYSFSPKTKYYMIIPLVSPDGVVITRANAISIANQTGQHLGVFKSKASAEKYAKALESAYKRWALASLKKDAAEDKELTDLTFQPSANADFGWYKGNINLFTRPIYINKDNSISTVLSVRFEFDSETPLYSEIVIVPRIISRNGVPTLLTIDEAEAHYLATNSHLGKYKYLTSNAKAKKSATAQAIDAEKKIHKQQDEYYGKFYRGEKDPPPKAWVPVWKLLENPKNVGPFAGIVSIADITETQAQTYFQENITKISVQYSMDLASQIQITINDPFYSMMNRNYFVPRRLITYRGRDYEIADVACRGGQSGSPEVQITICSRTIQQIKRDKKRGTVVGNSGYEYARNVALKYNLSFFGQRTAKTISQFNGSSGNQLESTWDVLNRTASSNQFVCFIVDDILIYAQHEFLMWKFGLVEALTSSPQGSTIRKYTPLLYIPGNDGDISLAELDAAGIDEAANIKYNSHILNRFGFRLETFPEFETSDNDALAANGSCRVLMPNGGQLRPGHTVLVGPEPDYFFGGYLVTDVSFDEGSPESAQVTFRTPEELKKQNGMPLVNRQGTSPLQRFKQRVTGV